MITHIVSFSGGLASAASAVLCRNFGLDYEIVFADTLIEHPSTYTFITEVAEALNKKLVWLKDGRDPWDVFVDKRYIGNTRTAHCSVELKTKQVRKWVKENYNDGVLILGMYKDEEERLGRAKDSWAPIEVKSLLIDYKIYPEDAKKLVSSLGVKEPELYKLGFPHNNCGGMCVRAGQSQFATLLRQRPEFYKEQEERQEWAMQQIGDTAKPFIRIMTDRTTEYFTMKQFREKIEQGEVIPKEFEMGGCGCFVDD